MNLNTRDYRGMSFKTPAKVSMDPRSGIERSFRTELHPVVEQVPDFIKALHSTISEEEARRGYFSESLCSSILDNIFMQRKLIDAIAVQHWYSKFNVIDPEQFEYLYGKLSDELVSEEFVRSTLFENITEGDFYAGTFSKNFRHALVYYEVYTCMS